MRVAIWLFPASRCSIWPGRWTCCPKPIPWVGDPQGPYHIEIFALEPGPVTALNGTRILPDRTIESSLEGYDTLLIAGSPGIQKYEDHAASIQWIVRESRHVRRIGSVCTGAFLLGHAGLLDGRAPPRIGTRRAG